MTLPKKAGLTTFEITVLSTLFITIVLTALAALLSRKYKVLQNIKDSYMSKMKLFEKRTTAFFVAHLSSEGEVDYGSNSDDEPTSTCDFANLNL